MKGFMRDCALSMKIPVGRPVVGERMIVPPGREGGRGGRRERIALEIQRA